MPDNNRKFRPGAMVAAALLFAVCGVAAFGADWVSLFDGKTLDGWVLRDGTGSFKVVNGVIVGTTPMEASPTSFLCTVNEYGDFELEFESKLDGGNSGMMIRSGFLTEEQAKAVTEALSSGRANIGGGRAGTGGRGPQANGASGAGRGRNGGGSAPQFPRGRIGGPQVEIARETDGKSVSGYIFGEAMPQGWLTSDADRVPHEFFKDDEWNQFRVVAKGPRIQTWINGHLIGDLVHEEAYRSYSRGVLGLQLHSVQAGTGPFVVSFRNLRIKPLD